MDMKPKIAAFTHGDPFNRHSFSGTNFGLFSALKKQGVLSCADDVELGGMRKYLTLLREFSLNKERWKQKFRRSHIAFMERSKIAGEILQKQTGNNCILQIGAKFTFNENIDVPIFSYHDNTAALSRKGGKYSFGALNSYEYFNKSIHNEREIYKRNNCIFTFSEHVKKSIVEDYGINGDKVYPVYCGVNMDTPIITDNVIDYKMNNKNILFVGVDFERKGGRVVLDAFKLLKKEFPSATLTIVGSSPRVNDDSIDVLGFVDQNDEGGRKRMVDAFLKASVFVMPSFFEPFGIPFIEAMYYKMPVIGTNIAAIPEMIKHGDNGFLIEPGDHVALARHLTDIFKEPNMVQVMGAAGFQIAQAKYSWDEVALKMINVVTSAI